MRAYVFLCVSTYTYLAIPEKKTKRRQNKKKRKDKRRANARERREREASRRLRGDASTGDRAADARTIVKVTTMGSE